MTPARPAAPLDPSPPRRRWPALLLAAALGLSPAGAVAQDWPAGPESQGQQLTQPLPWQPYAGHRGLYTSFELGLASATAGGGGKSYSLSTLSGGGRSPAWTFDFRLGHTLRPDLRLGLAFGGLVSDGSSGGLTSTAAIGHVGGELSWHPRLDGPFLRGELGLGWLQLTGSSSGPEVAGRDRTLTGPEVTVGGGYLIGLAGSSHLVGSLALSWTRYTSAAGLAGQLGWSLAWSAKVGFDYW
jgi:hypothetical protein